VNTVDALPVEAILAAASALSRGALVAFPTETVFGLGADATNPQAVARIYAAKDRPAFNPLIVHVENTAAAMRLTRWNQAATQLAAQFWPGPLTLVLPLAEQSALPPLVTAGLTTVAVRVPAHPVAAALLSTFGGPVAAPSANPSGRLSAVRAAHVRAALGAAVPHVLEGECRVGVESTIVDVAGDGWRILRPGSITAEAIAAVLGPPAGTAHSSGATITAPGQLASHYAPRLPLRLRVSTVREGEALLAFGPEPLPSAAAVRNLSPAGDLAEAARNLYLYLHELDQPGQFQGLAVMPVPEQGIGVAINDRLRRAAALK
jgi:L-threonylcarbamoyladenylate synthase